MPPSPIRERDVNVTHASSAPSKRSSPADSVAPHTSLCSASPTLLSQKQQQQQAKLDGEREALKLPFVRELLLENEDLLVEVMTLRRAIRVSGTAPLRELCAREALARRDVMLQEQTERHTRVAAASGAARMVYIRQLELQLQDMQDVNDSLQGFMALAKESLAVAERDTAAPETHRLSKDGGIGVTTWQLPEGVGRKRPRAPVREPTAEDEEMDAAATQALKAGHVSPVSRHGTKTQRVDSTAGGVGGVLINGASPPIDMTEIDVDVESGRASLVSLDSTLTTRLSAGGRSSTQKSPAVITASRKTFQKGVQ